MKFTHLLLTGMAIAASGIAQTGSIAGSVTDETGKALAGVLVYSASIGPGGTSSASKGVPPSPSFRTTTDSGGRFSFLALPAGLHQLCAIAAVAGQVSSCEWGARPLTTTLTAGATLQGLKLTMGSGDIVQIQVRDANSKISGGVQLLLGSIADNGSYRFAKLVSTVGQVLNYEMTIPTGRKSWLVVDTALQILDAQGAAVPAGKQTIALSGPTQITLSVH